MRSGTQPEGNKGVRPGQEGEILQRGGQELRLEKVRDRFTTQLAHAEALASLRSQWQPQSFRPVARGQLVEWQVPPAQLESLLTAARNAEEVQFASHVYHLQASPQTLFYLMDQITVQFEPGVSAALADELTVPLGLMRDRALTGIDSTYIFRVTQAAQENPIKIANRLTRHPRVLLAEPNIVVETELLYRPKDSLYSRQWHLQYAGGAPGAQALVNSAHIQVEKAWDITRGSRSVVVAVTDDAFDLNHPDLQGTGKIVAPRDLKHRDGLPMPSARYENHGTACAGLAIAEENGSGVVGVAPGCSLMPIQTTGFLDDESIEELFDWAMDHGAAVISCSWSPAAVYFPLSLRQRNAVTRAATQGRNGKGCVVVFSAGNANRPVSGKVEEYGWPSNALRGMTDWLGGFAVHPDVITVSAITSLNRKAIYSNWGNQVSVAAPSNNAPPSMALPDVGNVETGPVVQGKFDGLGMVTCDRTGAAGYGSGDYTDTFGGTSSACPVVAGVAGLILSANPHLEGWEVKQILQDTADKITDPHNDPQLGVAYGTYNNKGHSLWFGYGKVNAYAAVKAAQARLPQRTLSQTLTEKNSVTYPIPDGHTSGHTSAVTLTANGRVQDVQVYLDIDHDFLGDLSVALTAPSGRRILLQGRTLGQQTQLRKTYSLKTTPALSHLLDQTVRGQWRLQVIDHSPGNTGQLNEWQLTLGI
ncbi:MAG: S8 family serine peptidase [Cyanobacteria bacterium P01_A01_bin.105]